VRGSRLLSKVVDEHCIVGRGLHLYRNHITCPSAHQVFVGSAVISTAAPVAFCSENWKRVELIFFHYILLFCVVDDERVDLEAANAHKSRVFLANTLVQVILRVWLNISVVPCPDYAALVPAAPFTKEALYCAHEFCVAVGMLYELCALGLVMWVDMLTNVFGNSLYRLLGKNDALVILTHGIC